MGEIGLYPEESAISKFEIELWFIEGLIMLALKITGDASTIL